MTFVATVVYGLGITAAAVHVAYVKHALLLLQNPSWQFRPRDGLVWGAIFIGLCFIAGSAVGSALARVK
jgi:hypothetical protein